MSQPPVAPRQVVRLGRAPTDMLHENAPSVSKKIHRTMPGSMKDVVKAYLMCHMCPQGDDVKVTEISRSGHEVVYELRRGIPEELRPLLGATEIVSTETANLGKTEIQAHVVTDIPNTLSITADLCYTSNGTTAEISGDLVVNWKINIGKVFQEMISDTMVTWTNDNLGYFEETMASTIDAA